MSLGLGYTEIAIILVIALIVIGPNRLPELLRTVGKMMGQLRRTSDELRREILFSDEISDFRSTIDDIKDSVNPLKPPPVPPKLKTKPKKTAEENSQSTPPPDTPSASDSPENSPEEPASDE